MALKAALFSFSGIIINDDDIRQALSEQILLAENLRPNRDDYLEVCLGRSDRACLQSLLAQRGRSVNDQTLDKLLEQAADGYQTWLDGLDKLPIYPGLEDLIFRCRAAQIKMAIVTGSERKRVTSVLARAGLSEHFEVIIAGDDIPSALSKPAPDSYSIAIEQLNKMHKALGLHPEECIAIEDSFAGIESAQNAQIPVVGVAHTYPNHMLQRRATWVVDYLREINFDWIGEKFGGDSAEESLSLRPTDASSTESAT